MLRFVILFFACCGTLFSADSTLATIEQARKLTDAGQWEKARRVLDSDLTKAAKRSDRAAEARLKAAIAIHATDRNTYYKADTAAVESALRDARAAAQSSADKMAQTLLEQAEGRFTYWKAMDKAGSWDEPTRHFDRAMQLAEELGDQRSRGWAMFYRGLIYQMQEQNDPARETFERSLKLAQQSHDERLESYVVRHIGYLQQLAKDIPNARTNFRRSLELRERNDMKVFVPFAMIALADFEAEQGNKPEALTRLEEAVRYARTSNSPRALYLGQMSLAKMYLEKGRSDEARQLAEESRTGAEAFGSPESVKEANDFLASLQPRK
jgi:tetratricopeptide (TPR) repeat protein